MASEYALTIAITNTERTKPNVKSCGWRASTRKSSASKARAIAADIAKFAKGATSYPPRPHVHLHAAVASDA